MSFSKLIRWVNENNLVLIFITLYFLLSIIKIEHPGVNNDQLMFVNSATLNPDNAFLWKSFHGIPTMIFPYIGALKSYLYMPIFNIFGVNIWSIRIPQIVLTAITWLILYKTLLIAFNRKIALLAILFLSLDPSLIAYSKIDQGPTVLEFFLKVLAVYFLYLYLSTKKGIYLFCIFPTLALGIFNKLNFIWFVNGFIISFIIFYGKSFYNDFKRFDKLLPYLLIIIPYAFLIKIFFNISREVSLSYKNFIDTVGFSNIVTNVSSFTKNLAELINGNLLFNTIYGYNPTLLGRAFSLLVLLLIFTGGYLIVKQKKLKNYYFFTSIIFLMIPQLLLTRQAISPWHTLSIFPFFTVIFAAGMIQIYESIKRSYKNLILILLGALIFFQLTVNYIYISNYGKPTKAIAYSSSIYDLIDFAKNKKTIFVCLDVDICNQLSSFDQSRGKYKEPFGFLDPETYTKSIDNIKDYFNNPDFLYISHGSGNSHFPVFRKSFFEYIKDNKFDLVKIKQFMDGDTVAFEIYKINKN